MQKKDINTVEYENHLLNMFWRISIPIYLILLILTIFFNNPAPLMVSLFIFLIPDAIGDKDEDFKWKFRLILKNKYVKIFFIICILPFLIAIIYKNIL